MTIQPNDCEAWYKQGIALYKLDRYEEAISSFEQAIAIQPTLHQA